MSEIKYNQADAEALVKKLNILAEGMKNYSLELSIDSSKGMGREKLLEVKQQLETRRDQLYVLASKTAQVLSYASEKSIQLDNDIAEQLGGN